MPPRPHAHQRPSRGPRYSPVPLSPATNPRASTSASTASTSYPFSPSRKPVPAIPGSPSTAPSLYHTAHVRTPSTLAYSLPPSTPSYSVTRGVAAGEIGGDYGPYAYNPQDPQMLNANRFSSSSSGSNTSTSASSSSSDVHTVNPSHNANPNYPYYHDRPVPPPPPMTPAATSEEPLLPDLTIQESKRYTTTTTTATQDDPTRLPQYIYSKVDEHPEYDDAIHNPNHRFPWYTQFSPCSSRGWANVLALLAIVSGLITLFVGYPIAEYVMKLQKEADRIKGYNLGGINATGQVPQFISFPTLIDADTPEDVKVKRGGDGKDWDLVFSDEFGIDGRTFWPGDDPFWEAADLHYWGTGDLEYYDPLAITTEDGKLVITMTEQSINGLDYMSGMLTSWNKLCFTTGYVEVSISLPGTPDVEGFWPGAWSLGNLGRAGYGATTEGMWPYSYDSCDLGTFPNQTSQDGIPASAATGGHGGPISYQPGQKVSACTCPGNEHPGPSVSKGRGVPEIDILEAQIDLDRLRGQASQSFQIAPYDLDYSYVETTPATTIYDSSKTQINTYKGGVYQQSLSAVTDIDLDAYGGTGYSTYAYEWHSDSDNRDDGYIEWYYNDEKTWKVTSASVAPNEGSQVGQRLIPEEPMYLILNLGMAPSFQPINLAHLKFPTKMYIDYVRIYQREGTKNGLTCDPPDHPTKDYIDKHINAYTNKNLTTWEDAGYAFPKNSLYEGGC